MRNQIEKPWIFVLPFCIFLLISSTLSTQNPSVFETLGKIPNQEVTMVLDFGALDELRKKDQSFPASIKYKNASGDSVSWNVKIVLSPTAIPST
jgi:hypothetical protein